MQTRFVLVALCGLIVNAAALDAAAPSEAKKAVAQNATQEKKSTAVEDAADKKKKGRVLVSEPKQLCNCKCGEFIGQCGASCSACDCEGCAPTCNVACGSSNQCGPACTPCEDCIMP